ncbi:MAG: MptD family putative ECF transporter S component [Oscillospiraceae bacterium]|nr:MptD family putative ECF transporter S component [Oscillospiraceae bacterium]
MDAKLNAKDLINVGLYTAIYFVVVFAVAMVGYIPVFIPLLSVLVPLIAGIPFMLFLTKVRKFGMALLMLTLYGIIRALFGGVWELLMAVVCGLISELILRASRYGSVKMAVLAYGAASVTIFGNYIPIYISRDAYYARIIEGGMGLEYGDALMRFMPDWSAPALLVSCFVFGILGGLLGKAVLKKHFTRAGIA